MAHPNTVPVKIRQETKKEGHLIGHFEPDHLHRLEAALGEYGYYMEGDEPYGEEITGGDFVLGKSGAYFEFIVA